MRGNAQHPRTTEMIILPRAVKYPHRGDGHKGRRHRRLQWGTEQGPPPRQRKLVFDIQKAAPCRSGSHSGSQSLRIVDVRGRPNRVSDLLEHAWRSGLNCGSQTSKAREGSRPPWVQIPPLPPPRRENDRRSRGHGQLPTAAVSVSVSFDRMAEGLFTLSPIAPPCGDETAATLRESDPGFHGPELTQ
jgi:hypothetical protein